MPAAERREEVVVRAAEALRAEYGRRWQKLTSPIPVFRKLLQTLNRLEIKLGVLTNKPDNFAKEMVQAYFSEITFAVVVGAMPSLPIKT